MTINSNSNPSLVVRPDVRLEPGRLAEALVAVLAPDLAPDAVRAQVVPEEDHAT